MEKLYICEDISERYEVKVLTIWDWIRKKKLKAEDITKMPEEEKESVQQNQYPRL